MEGGKPDFHAEKNSSRLPTRVWHDMYNLENREQSLFNEDTCNFVLGTFDFEG